MEYYEYGIVCGAALTAAALAGFGAVRQSKKQISRLRQDITAKIQRLEMGLLDLERRPELRPAYSPQPDAVAYRGPEAAPTRAGPSGFPGDMNPEPPARRSREQFSASAAMALQDQQSFREFAASSGGSGFLLRAGAEAEPSNGPNADTAADLWIVADDDTRLVYPGFNLRRSQSALVADSGRLARERLDWLYDVVSGPQLGATRPARVAAKDWTVIERGVLAVPFRVG